MLWFLAACCLSDQNIPLPDSSLPLPTGSPSPEVIFVQNATHHAGFNILSLFYNAEQRSKTFKLLDKELKLITIFDLFNSPFIPDAPPLTPDIPPSPIDAPLENDVWGCWLDMSQKQHCERVANYEYPYQIVNNPNLDVIAWEIPGFPPYKLQVQVQCNLSISLITNDPNMSLIDGKLYVKYISEAACPKLGVFPTLPVPVVTPEPKKTIDVKFHERAELVYFEYNISKFEQSNIRANLILSGSYEKVNIFALPGGLLDCPKDYNCTKFEKASVWKCWTDFYEDKYCFPVADYRHGVKLTSTSIQISGGAGGYSVEMPLSCNQKVEREKIKWTGHVSESSDKIITITGSTGALCPNKFYPVLSEKQPSLGGFIVVGFWILVGIFMGFGIAFNYALHSTFKFPLASFWTEFGFCVKNGWEKVTCDNKIQEKNKLDLKSDFA